MTDTFHRILLNVQKPARYLGGEYNQIVKDRADVDVRVAFCFPDTYEIGMSNIGMRILYGVMNEMEGVWCERVFAPWGDMETEMRKHGLPLWALESHDPVSAFDLIAFTIGYEMHTTAMKMCRPGVVERQIAGAIEGVAKAMGQGVSFPSIVSQHGETLHNLNADGVLEEGRLLLCDAGGESVEGYCSDHTRTYPVSGRFTQQQREIYDIVLAAHDHVAGIVKPHMMYTEVHNAAYMTLAEGLVSLGLLKGTAADAVAAGAMTMLMPHGLGHGLGMDVHDCEAMGERSFDFSSIAERAAKSGTCIYRAAWRLEPGTVMTDEPGLYFIPALIDKCRAEGLYKGIVDYDALDAYRNFGGIRIEDDILVTETGSRMLGDRKIPVTAEEVESIVGR